MDFLGRELLTRKGLIATWPAEADYSAGVDAVPHLRVLDLTGLLFLEHMLIPTTSRTRVSN